MRVLAVTLIVAFVALAGCADNAETTPEEHDHADHDHGSEAIKQIVLSIELENATVQSGVAFNVTLTGTVVEAVAESSEGNATQHNATGNTTVPGLRLFQSQNATDGNATDGNATQNGTVAAGDLSNATWRLVAEYQGNATNGTTDSSALVWEGTGLPATIPINLTGNGSFILVATAEAEGHASGEAQATVDVIAVVEDLPPMEPIVFEGTVTGAWAGEYVGTPESHTFVLDRVPELIHVRVAWGTTAWDMDFDLFAPDGSEALSVANFNDPALGDGNSYEEGTLTDANQLGKLGEWTLTVVPAGSIEGDYTATISFASQ